MSAFVRAARRGENHWAFYLLTIVVVFIGYFLGQVPLLLVLNEKVTAGMITTDQVVQFFEEVNFDLVGIPSHIGLLLLLGSFIAAAIILLICVEFVHKRPFRLLVNPTRNIDYGKIFFGFGLWFLLTAVAEVAMYLIAPGDYRFHLDWSAWLPLVVVAVLVLPIQTSFEELLTRGYILQGLGLASRSKVIAIVGSSVFFAAMHLANPEISEFGFGIMMVYYLSVAICLAVITLLDEGLEFALGIHAATNIYGATCVSFAGSALQTDALIKVDQINPALMLGLFYATIVIFFVIIRKKYKLKPLRTLFTPIQLTEPEHLTEYEAT